MPWPQANSTFGKIQSSPSQILPAEGVSKKMLFLKSCFKGIPTNTDLGSKHDVTVQLCLNKARNSPLEPCTGHKYCGLGQVSKGFKGGLHKQVWGDLKLHERASCVDQRISECLYSLDAACVVVCPGFALADAVKYARHLLDKQLFTWAQNWMSQAIPLVSTALCQQCRKVSICRA